MADIKKYTDNIRKAIYGKEVRGSLADGIEAINDEVEDNTEIAVNVERRQDAVEGQFDDVLSEWSDDREVDNAETIAARTNRATGENHKTLGNRLDDENKELNEEISITKAQLGEILVTVLETTIGVDIQGIDWESLKRRGERLPVDVGNREVVVEEIVSRAVIRDREKVQVPFPQEKLRKFKEFDFFIINNLDSDVRISFAVDPGYGYSSLMTTDGEALLYRTSDDYLHHRVPADSRNIRLSDIKAKTVDGERVAVNKKPFGDLYLKEFLYLEYRPSRIPTSGDLTIQIVGVPI